MSTDDPAPTLTPAERLAVQISQLSTGTDLRHYLGDPAARDMFWRARELRDDVYRGQGAVRRPEDYWSHEGRVSWAAQRLRVRAGLSSNTWWYPPEHPDKHTHEDDLRLLLNYLDDIDLT